MCETCGTWTCPECGYHHYTMAPAHDYAPQCDRCGYVSSDGPVDETPVNRDRCPRCHRNSWHYRHENEWRAQCVGCGHIDMRVSYAIIRGSAPDTVYIDENGHYWTAAQIIEEMDVAGLDYNDASIEWIQFYAVPS